MAEARVRHLVLGLGLVDAAAAIGISSTKFRELVDAGRMPKPRKLDSRLLWDVDELRDAFKALPHDGERPRRNTWDEDRAA